MRKIGRVLRISSKLKKMYGARATKRLSDPLDTLIATILSQNTSDKNSIPAFNRLKKHFGNWDEARRAKGGIISSLIKPAGLYRIKSLRIKNCLDQIYKAFNKTDLKRLRKMPPKEAEGFLKSMKGVGPKTLSVVMLFALGAPYFPADTHVLRVSKRLGIIPEGTSPVKAHELLAHIIPARLMGELHLNMIEHGRRCCRARNPKCGICLLKRVCKWYRTTRGQRSSR